MFNKFGEIKIGEYIYILKEDKAIKILDANYETALAIRNITNGYDKFDNVEVENMNGAEYSLKSTASGCHYSSSAGKYYPHKTNYKHILCYVGVRNTFYGIGYSVAFAKTTNYQKNWSNWVKKKANTKSKVSGDYCGYGSGSFTTNTLNRNRKSLTQTKNLVKAGNKFVTLLGNQVNIGEKAPEFKVVDGSFAPITLSDFKEKTLLISVVPSLDTGVCSIQTKRFNDQVANLPADVVMLTISNDLPFAQKRFCKAEKVNNIKVLSDAVWRDFGQNYGLLIKDMGLLTRAIFIVDKGGKIAYKELVANISQHPDYDSALAKLKAISQPKENVETVTEAIK